MVGQGYNVAALGFGGIDTNTLVTSLVAIAAKPGNALAAQQQSLRAASTSISSFASALSALKGAATALSDPAGFGSTKASSSSAAVVATTASTGPSTPGQWQVSVSQIAQTQRTISNGAASPTTALGVSGTLGLSLGDGTSASIAITSDESLTDVARAITSSGLRLTASTVFDGTQSRLLVSGLDTGRTQSITFDESGLSFDSSFSFGWDAAHDPSYNANATMQAAQDTVVQIGGGSGYAATSSTGLIAGAVPGLTIAATQTTTAPVTVTVASDPTGLQQTVQSFVDAYNGVVDTGHGIAGFGQAKASNPVLQSDHAVRTALHQLAAIVSTPVQGTPGPSSDLSSIGLSLGKDGKLTFDAAKFASAVQADFASVSRLSSGAMKQIGNAIDALTSSHGGAITARANALSSRATAMTGQISAMQSRLDKYQSSLQDQFARMNTAMTRYNHISDSLTAFDKRSKNT